VANTHPPYSKCCAYEYTVVDIIPSSLNQHIKKGSVAAEVFPLTSKRMDGVDVPEKSNILWLDCTAYVVHITFPKCSYFSLGNRTRDSLLANSSQSAPTTFPDDSLPSDPLLKNWLFGCLHMLTPTLSTK